MIASVKESELAEKMIYWTRESRRRSKETDEPPTHTVGQEQTGVFPITRTSRAPSPPSQLFNWPQTKSEREQCDGAERKGRAEGAHRSLESSGWSPLLRKEIERVNSNGGSLEHRLQCRESFHWHAWRLLHCPVFRIGKRVTIGEQNCTGKERKQN